MTFSFAEPFIPVGLNISLQQTDTCVPKISNIYESATRSNHSLVVACSYQTKAQLAAIALVFHRKS